MQVIPDIRNIFCPAQADLSKTLGDLLSGRRSEPRTYWRFRLPPNTWIYRLPYLLRRRRLSLLQMLLLLCMFLLQFLGLLLVFLLRLLLLRFIGILLRQPLMLLVLLLLQFLMFLILLRNQLLLLLLKLLISLRVPRTRRR